MNAASVKAGITHPVSFVGLVPEGKEKGKGLSPDELCAYSMLTMMWIRHPWCLL